jgi:hypothetical protein
MLPINLLNFYDIYNCNVFMIYVSCNCWLGACGVYGMVCGMGGCIQHLCKIQQVDW